MGSSPSKSRQNEISLTNDTSGLAASISEQSSGNTPQIKTLKYWEPNNTLADNEQLLSDKADVISGKQIGGGKNARKVGTTSNGDHTSQKHALTFDKQERTVAESEQGPLEFEQKSAESGTIADEPVQTIDRVESVKADDASNNTATGDKRTEPVASDRNADRKHSSESESKETFEDVNDEFENNKRPLSPGLSFSDQNRNGENADDNTELKIKWRKQINFGNDSVNKLKKVFVKGKCSYDEEFSNDVHSLFFLLVGLPGGHPEKRRYCKREFGKEMVKVGIVDILSEICIELLPETGKEKEINPVKSDIIDHVLNILLSMTDESEDVCIIVSNKDDVLESMAEVAVCHDINDSNNDVIVNVLSIIYNCSRRASNRARLREVGFVWILKRLLRCESDFMVVFVIAVALAGIMTEDECKIFQTVEWAIKVVKMLFAKALESRERQFMGASARELAEAVSRLGISDSNKMLLLKFGILEPIQTLCKVGDLEEQAEALSALWTLAFQDDIKGKILMRDGLIDLLVSRRESPDDTVKTGASNILWTLREKLKASSNPKFIKLGEELCRPVEKSPSSENDRHIMISYQWHVKKQTIFKLHDILENNGYKVWLDRKEMKGSMTEAMALAVENAEVFLMCISQSYKESDNCRAEADYAFSLKKHIIPLMMEKNYIADGWLGLIKGLKKHYDFSEDDYFDMIFEDLLKEIGGKGKSCLSGKPVTAGLSGHGGIPTSDVPNWTREKVNNWLKDNDCKGKGLQSLTGKQLMFFKRLKSEAPEYFYTFLESKLKLGNVEDLTTFVEALARLK